MSKEHFCPLTDIADYYSAKLTEHGETFSGVDWNSEESHKLRFEQLCKIINTKSSFSINDLGCGYGAFLEFLNHKYDSVVYSGIDISEKMIRTAKNRYKDREKTHFIISNAPKQVADYSIASGIFNVRLGRPDYEWMLYIENTLDILSDTSRIGFSFNCLTSYSDKNMMREYLYYADPCLLFDLCKRRFSYNVALLHDYGLYEFTILVRKKL